MPTWLLPLAVGVVFLAILMLAGPCETTSTPSDQEQLPALSPADHISYVTLVIGPSHLNPFPGEHFHG